MADQRSDGDLGDLGDDELLEVLRVAAAEADPVPEAAVVGAQAAYTWRTVDAELAELTYDSLVDHEPAGALRSSATATATDPRALTFEHAEVMIDIEVAAAAAGYDLIGQVMGRDISAVVVERGGGVTHELAVDDLGRFRATGLAPGPFRLRCGPGADTPRLSTDWLVL